LTRPPQITDAQVHVWADPTPERPWPADGPGRAHRPQAFGVDDLLAEMDAAHVDRAVLVPPSFEGDHNDLVLTAAREHPDRFAVMARIPLADPNASELLAGLATTSGVYGLRLTFDRGASADWLYDGTADWLWEAAEQAGMAVMVWAPGKLDGVARVCAEHPGLRLVLDSLGLRVGLQDEEIDAPLEEVVALARYPNLAVKASALPAYVSDPYPFRSLGPRVERVLDAFGPERVFWASDLTRLSCTYTEAATFLAELEIMSEEELAWVMGRGVGEWLGWAQPRTSVSRSR
jgi:predicted TIM-barrel fold metal-dependent hydrolase